MAKRFWRKPLDAEKHKLPRGEVHIIEERCKGCGFCIEFCPKGVLAVSEKRNPKGYRLPYAKNEEACVVCGLCEAICPDFAIFAVPRESTPDENPEDSGSSLGKDFTG